MTENFDKLVNIIENKQLTKEQKLQEIKPILDEDKSVLSETGDIGKTILHYAACTGSPKIIQCLLGYGASLTACNDNDETPIHYAVQARMFGCKASWEIVKVFLDNGVDVNVKGRRGTPLHCAAKLGELEIVNGLIKYGADVNAEHGIKNTPLHYAASWEVAEVLLDTKKVDINATNEYNHTVLYYAAQKGRLDFVDKLIEHGINTKIRANDGYTLLHAAAEGQNLEIVEKFFNFIDINIEDSKGYTPILYAWEKGQNNSYEIVNFLLNKGVSIVPKNCKIDILSELALDCDINAIEYLLKHGADINKSERSYEYIIRHIGLTDHVKYIQTFKCMRMHIAKLDAAKMTISKNSSKFKDVSELLSKLPVSLAEVPELLQGLSEKGVILLNGQFVYPNAENEYNEYLKKCKEEVKKLEKEDIHLRNLLKEDDISGQIETWAKSKQIYKQFDARENIEGLEELYPEYGGMIAYKILEVKKEIFTRNNKPLIKALSKHYGWHGLQNISYEDLLTFLKSNKDNLVKKLKSDVQKFYNIVMNIDHNTNILALPWPLEMQAAAQYISNSKLDNPNVQQVTCSTLSK